MSKIKIIDLNKQLKTKSKETVERMESLQTSVQSHLATLKRIEADLIKIARAEAEERKLRQEQEAAAEQAKAAEQARVAEQAKAAEQAKVAEQAKTAEQAKAVEQAKAAEQVKAVEQAKAAEQVKVVEQAEAAEQVKVVEQTKAAEQAKAVEQTKAAETAKPERSQSQGYQRDQRPQGQRPYNNDQRPQGQRSYNNDQRPQGQRAYNNDQRPQGQRAYNNDQRPQGQRPYNNNQRPQGQRSYNNDQSPQGQRPYNNSQRPQGQRPYGNDQRPQGQRPYSQHSNDQRPQGQRPYGQRSNDQRPQGQRPYGQRTNDQRPQGQRPYGQRTNDQRPQGQRPYGQRTNDQRPQGQRPQGVGGRSTSGFVHVDNKKPQNKKHNNYNNDDRNRRSKKLKEKGVFEYDERYRSKKRSKKIVPKQPIVPIVIDKAVMTTEMISVKSLAEKTGKPVAAILKKLLLLGMMCTINSELDYDTAQLICSEFKITLELKLDKTAEDVLDEGDQVDKTEDLQDRPPIVTIMGHVDHGKTSLLDAIRQTRVTEHEAGGITQHIGAYTIKHNGSDITFLDTPGHEAFTAMRARGAQVTDIAILVVAADDGVMPQTVEAINHAKAADVPIIVAINKIDRPNANPEKIKQELTEHGLITEDWGGDTVMVPVSAITKEGLDQLLEMIVLVSEVQELKANPNRLAKGTIVEAKLDKGRGPVATVLVQNGTLRIQDMIVAGVSYGRVRAMVDDMGNRVDEALPSQPVEVVGFSEVPTAGDTLHAVEENKLTRQVAEERKDKQKADMLKNLSKVSLDDLFGQVEQGKLKDLNLLIKADVQGSVEAVRQALEKMANKEVRVKVIHAGVGAIKAMDVMLASASNAIIIGFNVRPDSMARIEAEKEKVEIRMYRVIYKAIEDIEKAMTGMLAPEFEEVILGHAEVRTIFNVSSIGTIAGSYVTDGKITKTSSVRLLRDNIVVHEGVLASLKRFKDDAKEVKQGFECGITIKNYNDVKEGDVIEAFEMQEIER